MIHVMLCLVLSLLVMSPSSGFASLTDEVKLLVKKVDARYLKTQDFGGRIFPGNANRRL